ncbi:MAG TPA: MotA/TolQ/ExbB proton channel family protein [Burkholderiales bacterium]|nr:MotA/TolQ/ExbB proton channel family protein [Burkholderiales bacterium]
MNKHSWIAVILFTGIFVGSFALQGNAALFVNGVAFAIVVCGTLGAMFLCYPAADLRAALRVTRNLYSDPPPTSREVIDTLLEMALHSRGKGVLALESMSEQSTISFMKRALGLLVDGIPDEELAEILHAEMFNFKQRRAQFERMFRQAALFAPAFGVAGSVVGLIDMLAGISNPDVILKTIPLALTAPLYGIVLANSVFFPVAESIHSKTQKELLVQRLIADGVAVIRREPNPRRLAIKLESFLTPSARTLENLSLGDIRARLRNLRQALALAGDAALQGDLGLRGR